MANRRGKKEISTIYKILHRKKIKQHWGELRCPEGLALLAPLVIPVVLLLNDTNII